nr:hypothetical protein [Rhodobacter sp.]
SKRQIGKRPVMLSSTPSRRTILCQRAPAKWVNSSRGTIVKAMIGLHELALTIVPLLLLTHFAGALWHKIVRRDGVLESMTGRLPI